MGDGWCPFATKRVITQNNFTVGRGGQIPRAICLHIAEGSLEGTFATFNNPANVVSAHFCIGKQGQIHQYVSINDTAYANGLRWNNGWFAPRPPDKPQVPVNPPWPDIIPGVNPNDYTISIEHEGKFQELWTPAMYDANNRVLQWIATEVAMVYVPHRTLLGHMDINPIDRPNCPGPNVDYVKMSTDANMPTPLTPLEQAVQNEARQHTWMPINTGAALYKFAEKNKLGYPQCDEFHFTVGADQYIGQVFNSGIVYVKVGDWANVKWVKKP